MVSPPPRPFLPMGIGGDTIDALSWRCLVLATPTPGDAYAWRRLILQRLILQRLILATATPGVALSGQPVDFLPWAPWMGPTIYLTLVNARERDDNFQIEFSE